MHATRQPFFKAIFASTFDIIGWHAAGKAQLMLFLSIILSILLVAHLAVLTYLDFGVDKNLNGDFVSALLPYVYAYIVLCALFWLLGYLPLVHRGNLIQKYVTTCLLFYTLGNIGFIHLVGELSLWAGVLAAGTPIIGWILFDFKSVLIAYLAGTSLAVIAYFLTVFNVVEYAPLVASKANIHNNTAWLVVVYGVGIPHVFCLLLVAYISIKHWRSREENVRYMACVDALTHVANRWHFMEQLDVEINRMQRQKMPISLLMVDLDHFKKINDKHGHIVGDKVIQQTAITLVQSLRKVDLVGRYGGEEFCILLPSANADNAVRVAKRCLENIAALSVNHEGLALKITVSIGVSTMLVEHMGYASASSQALFAAADAALYQSKHRGRNQVHFQALTLENLDQEQRAYSQFIQQNPDYRQRQSATAPIRAPK